MICKIGNWKIGGFGRPDKGTMRKCDKERGGQGDMGTKRQGDKGTSGIEDKRTRG